MAGFADHSLTPELADLKKRVIGLAKDCGLSFYPIKFLLVTPKELNAIAAYGGFPSRIPHWTHGGQYEELQKKQVYGAGKIYELVINSNPVYAYLLSTNATVDQKLVMAHVCGHADFFKHNCWFSKTDRSMLNQMANNASRIKRIIQTVGELETEEFIDACKSIENLIDPYLDHIKRKRKKVDEEGFESESRPVHRLPAKEYMDGFINTKEFLQNQKKKIEADRLQEKNFPDQPDRDILGFLVEHAPLEPWQRAVLGMIREESYYFAPQMMTKIMNEGWASYWHSKLMTEKLADETDIIDYCETHSGVIAMGKTINPYRLGIELYKDIEDRWNRGAFGPEYNDCNNAVEKEKWDKKLGLGKEKIFQVRKTHNDLTFLDTFLTPEFCVKNKLYSYKPNSSFDVVEIDESFKKIKDQFMSVLVNAGQPVIQVEDANYDNKGELLLGHVFDGKELDYAQAQDVLANIYKIWSRPVHIQTVEEEIPTFWSFDGEEHTKLPLV